MVNVERPGEARPPGWRLLPGLAGTGPHGSFFEVPGWVDKSKKPGMTSQESVVAPPWWWLNILSGKFLFFSPNIIWLIIAFLDYFLFPYDFKAAKRIDNNDWILKRWVLKVYKRSVQVLCQLHDSVWLLWILAHCAGHPWVVRAPLPPEAPVQGVQGGPQHVVHQSL